MKRLLLLAMSAILLTVCVKAQQTGDNSGNPADSSLVVCLKDGSQKTFLLKQSPKIIFEGENVIVETTEKLTYDFMSISKMSFLPEKIIKGDVNGDKTVNMADVYEVVSMILAGLYNKAGDVNEDGKVNVADIVAIQSIVKGKSSEVNETISLTRGAIDDNNSQTMIVRLLQNSGETIDFEANRINSIDFTTKSMTINYGTVSNTTAIDDIESLLYMSPALMLTAKSLDFGKVEVDYAKTLPVTLTNTGDYPETYTILTDGVFAVKTPYQEMTVMAGQSVTIDLTFMPKEVKAYNASLMIASNSAVGGMLSLPVSGEGVATAAEEVETIVEPTEQEIVIALAEDEVPESFSEFKVSNFYGDFPVESSATASGLSRTRQGGNNQYACTANVPVSPNGLQFHSFIDGQGNPWMFSISLPEERPEISFTQTAIALLMSTPELMTSNEADYRNAVQIIEHLEAFPSFVRQVADAYHKGKMSNQCPDYSQLNTSSIQNELYGKFRDTRELRLSGVSLESIQTTPLEAKYQLRNDFKRTVHIYTHRARMNEGNMVVVEQEEASSTFQEMLDMLIDETLNQVEGTATDLLPALDSEDIDFIGDLKEWINELEEYEMEQYPALGKAFHLHLPYILSSKGIDYLNTVFDSFEAWYFDLGWEKSIFEVKSGTINVPFEGYDKILVDVYGVGMLDGKSWKNYSVEEQIRIIFACLWGAYDDYLKPFYELVTGIEKSEKTWNLDYKYDFRYGARKYPEFALVAKLFMSFVKDKSNVDKLIKNFDEHNYWGVSAVLTEFVLKELTKIPKESDKASDKRTYTNLIYNIYKKWTKKAVTSETFRQTFKAGANRVISRVNFVLQWMNNSAKGVDIIGAINDALQSKVKETHIIDKYNKPFINMIQPKDTYSKSDMTVHFEWETYKSNTYGEYVYDLEMMTEMPSGVVQTVVKANIDGNSYDYNLQNLSGAGSAMKIYYRLIAHHPDRPSQIYVETDFLPLVWRVTAEAPEMVDLGLPSGTLWAQYNLGTTQNEAYGNHYAWGETTTKDVFSWSNYKYCKNGKHNALTKYNTKSSYGTVDNKTQLDEKDDAIKSSCGYYYGIPTKKDWEELIKYCKWSVHGNGVVARGPNGSIIYFPPAGYRSGYNHYDAESDGYYWSSTLDSGSPDDAWFVHVSNGKAELQSYYRCAGRSIRVVQHKGNYSPPSTAIAGQGK